MDYGVMDSAFAKGDTAMIINGPWGWANADKAGIDYGVTNIPMINGQTSKPMVGILAAQISSASPNKDLAIEFLENYLLSVEGLTEINNDKALGAVANKEFQQILESDARIKATMASAQNGATMPSYPEMPKFWDAATKALENIAAGRQTVTEALADADKAMIR
jgi:maltose/maltodextrin transport system substrate-binding protein